MYIETSRVRTVTRTYQRDKRRGGGSVLNIAATVCTVNDRVIVQSVGRVDRKEGINVHSSE
jgi:hypothetical protein